VPRAVSTALPRSQRASVTNDPLGLPVRLSLLTAAGRRWRDLAYRKTLL
jgi:hypothetical protein